MSTLSVDYVLAIPGQENQETYHSPLGRYYLILNPRSEDKMESIDIYCAKSDKKLFNVSISDFIEVIWGYEKVAIVCYLGTWICCLKTGTNFRLPISGSTFGFVAAFSPNSESFAFLNRLHSLEILNLQTNEIIFYHRIYNRIQKFKWYDPVVLNFKYEDETYHDINLLGFLAKTSLAMLMVEKRRLSLRLPHELWEMTVYNFLT